MAEHTNRERLQPSLLDRLTDDAPDKTTESRDQRVLSLQRLRASVLRDLGWLLNTVNLSAVNDLSDYPELANSVLNYGVPDLAGHTASSVDVFALERLLKESIVRFEPRLVNRKLKVKLDVTNPIDHNTMVFIINCDLWAQPVALNMDLKTEVDLELGHVEVSVRAARANR